MRDPRSSLGVIWGGGGGGLLRHIASMRYLGPGAGPLVPCFGVFRFRVRGFGFPVGVLPPPPPSTHPQKTQVGPERAEASRMWGFGVV